MKNQKLIVTRLKEFCPQKLMTDLSIEVDIAGTVWDYSEVAPYE